MDKNTFISNGRKKLCVKSAQIRSYFWSEYRKIKTRNNSVFGHFSLSEKNNTVTRTSTQVLGTLIYQCYIFHEKKFLNYERKFKT